MGPFRCVNMVVTITINSVPYTVGVVEGMDIQLGYKGGPESHYGSRIMKHSAGAKEVTMTLTRWYYADEGQEDLLLNLITDETEFDLEGYLVDKDGSTISNTILKITGCRLYKYRPRTGGADDIIGEEGSGSGTDWDISGFKPSTP
jgi:hypothetical protein